VAAFGDAGAADIAIVNRSADRAASAAALAPGIARSGTEADVEKADLLVNATPVGMEGAHANELPISVDHVGPGHVVVDLIYHPSRTVLLEKAAGCGARVTNGVGMLVFQAAEQIALWTGRPAPIEAMRAVL
jgi:shikimate dehydrogenase